MRLSLTLVLLVGLSVAAHQPQFKSGVQLLTVDASVRDKSGNAVPDLKPSDFTVTIDGKPRAVVFAQYFHSEPSTIAGSSNPIAGRYRTNDESPAGHVVVFAIDRNALPPGTERPLLESAAAMLAGLSPADSVGLVEIPGRTFDVTRETARIGNVLQSITGMPQPRASARNVSFDEARGFERHDLMTIRSVYARECDQAAPARGRGQVAVGDLCPPEVQMRAREVLAYERNHAQMLLAALTSIVRQLEPIRAPKHVVLVSAGLPFDPEFIDRFKMFEQAAAEARVTVDTIRVHDFAIDASSDAKGGSGLESPAIKAGMDTLATMTGGQAYAPAGAGAGIFTRIVSDVTSFYQLGVESAPGDSNGKLHDVKVHVARPNLETLARPSVAVPPPTPPSGLLDVALKQPIDVGAVPIAVSTYSMFAAAGASRVLVAAEIGAAGSSAPAEWGVVVLKDGTSVASTRGRIPGGPERPQFVTTNMELPAGSYRLRVGAVDADGGTGTLEIPFTAGGHYVSAGARISDLMLGVTTGKEFEPRSRLADTDEITAFLQVAGGATTGLTATVQFVRAGSTTAAATAVLGVAGTPGGSTTLQGTIDGSVLSPGRYTAEAVVRSGEQVLGRVSRLLEVIPGTRPAPAVPSSAAPAPLTTDAPVAELMKRVAGYVERYGDAASVLVGVERYTQKSDEIQSRTTTGSGGVGRFGAERGPASPTPVRTTARKLTSELALVRNTAAIGGWLAFRDVTEVDGKTVADRGDRLRALFDSPSPDLEVAQRLSTESSRFNVGPVKRTFNVPTVTLFFFTPANLRRFAFKQRGIERIDGAETRVIDFHETARPTMIMNGLGKDVPASGTLWVDPTDGHVIKTVLTITGYAGTGSGASVEVTFRHHQDFDMWVPALMHESYVTSAGGVTGDAQYVDFRRFQTSAKIKK